MSAIYAKSVPRRRVILIGIGGSSASGKSTLAAALAKELSSPLKVFSADHYLDFNRVRSVGSWETPAGIAWDDLRSALEDTAATLREAECLPPSIVVGGFSRGPLELVPRGQGGKALGPEPAVIVVEGFLIYSDKKLCDMLDLSLWLNSHCDVCAHRRYNREGQRGAFANYLKSFRQDVWHHYELYRGQQLANVPNVLQLDGAVEPQSVVVQALTYCKGAVESGGIESGHQNVNATMKTTQEGHLPVGFGLNPEPEPKGTAQPIRRHVIIIGVGGSSASGKSILAAALAKELSSPLKVFSADHYLDFKRVRSVGSWETPAGIAWDDLRSALEDTATTLREAECLPPSIVVGGFSRGPLELVPHGQGGKSFGPEPAVIIVEGFLLFHDKQLCDMLDLSLWLDSDCDVCARRRYNREGQPGEFEDYIEDFREEVWQHHQLYRGEQLANIPKALHLNSASEPQDLIIEAFAHCSVAIKSAIDKINSTIDFPAACKSISGDGSGSSSTPLGREKCASTPKQSDECASISQETPALCTWSAEKFSTTTSSPHRVSFLSKLVEAVCLRWMLRIPIPRQDERIVLPLLKR